ncbi:MAG: peptide deformylase [Chitinophagales bacterium]
MSSLHKIIKLGNPLLYQTSIEVQQNEVDSMKEDIDLLHSLVLEFRAKYGAGRAIAAPQIGLMKRIICMNTDKRYTIINPVLSELSAEMMELWDDCMCFPNLHVRVQRHRYGVLTFRDENWVEHRWELKDDLSELIQHEYDHLDGILATQRAIDGKAFRVV